MKTQKTIIITGTHHTPAIALVENLRQDPKTDWNIFYIGHIYPTESHIVHTIIPKLNVKFYHLDCGKFNRRDILKTILDSPKILSAVFKSVSLISKIKPDIVVSFGGYVSVPVIVAAYFKNIPSITHEQTLTNSLSTRINSLFVNKIALSFDNPSQKLSLPSTKTIVTGNLIRQAIYDQKSLRFNKMHLSLARYPLIYITGGNQGSQFINQLVYKLVPDITNKFTVIHQTGKNINLKKESLLKKNYLRYLPFEFIETEDIGWVLNQAHIVVSRAGANICQELDLLHKNALLIPLPFTQQKEQLKNANWLKSRHPGQTIIINQSDATTKIILNALSSFAKTESNNSRSKILPKSLFINLIYDLIG